ncbi:MAG: two-component regulator propeller domain-containing protein [Paludibacter sp.]|nr:two-component regulator propeller domain-containing protein [Paludibacter sp.]
MRKLYLAVLLLVMSLVAKSQTIAQISHYSVDDGLSENNVMCMLQDRKGTMWFGTYDGLNKYDGYTFRNFKGNQNQQYRLINYRIDRIREDKQGYLWLQTYDGRTYRFDTSTETFLPIPQCVDEYKNSKASFREIQILNDGSIWLVNKDAGSEDCFRVQNSTNKQKVIISHFTKDNGNLSSNHVNKVYIDKQQNTWILTSNGINLLKKGSSKPIQIFNEAQSGNIYSILEKNQNIYIGGEQGKFRIFDIKKGTFDLIRTPFTLNIIDIQQISSTEIVLINDKFSFYIYNTTAKTFQEFKLPNKAGESIYGCYKDKRNNLWIGTQNSGVIYFDSKLKKINFLETNTPEEFSGIIIPELNVIEDKFDNTWICTKKSGLFKYNRNLNILEPFYNNPNSNERKFSNLLHTAISDIQGNLWLSTYSQGIDKVVFRESQFTFTKPLDIPIYSNKNEIRSIFQDSKKWIWAGSKKGLVYLYDENKKLRGLLGFDGKINGNKPFDVPVYNIMEDRSGTIWLASKGMGLFKVNRKSDNTFIIRNFQYNPQDIYSLSSNAVYSVFQDHLNQIWVGTYGGGINLIDNSTGELRFISNRNKLKNYPINECYKVRYVTEDKNGYIFVGTTEGLVVFRNNDRKPEEISFARYIHNSSNKYSLSGNDVQYILPTRNGNLYLALFGGGLNILKQGYNPSKEDLHFEVIKKNDGSFFNVIYTLKEDDKGCVWMSTQTKIVKYNSIDSKFDIYKPIASNNYFFIEAAVSKTKQGEILYGTSNGFVSFNPLKISKSIFVPRICLTQLQIFNKPVQVGENDSPLEISIDDTKELILNHKQNIFSIEFASLDYINPKGIQYAYKLEGFENEWNYVGNQQIATYTNLPKGRYIFHVKSTNSDGEWVNNEKTIVIIKQPSFWESIWGLLFYVCLFFLLLGLTTYILFTIYRLRNEVNVEHRITNMKLRFFTDISHELRTPLTLIASPVENLLQKEIMSDNAKEQLQIVQRNTDRMLRLINQILDFRKVQNKKMNLIIEAIDVKEFVNEICISFKKLAEDKNIDLKITNKIENAQLWVDKDKFEKIIYNLLSNAFKFSQSKNTIEIILSDESNVVVITIKDQGIGISKDKMKLLFERFESFASTNTAFQASTGIGLSLTKELVELHHAKIEVESESGKGSAFRLIFKKGFEHYNGTDDFMLKDLNQPGDAIESDVTANENTESELNIYPLSNELMKILIVEDNKELRTFLKSVLSVNYDVFEAENGVQGLDIALTYSPDIIVSDVMMPDMDGLELAKAIKSNINISHIPLILLTAKTDIESKLEALECGVDDYITKPFSSTYLEARIENLLKLRKQLQTYFQSSLTSGIISMSKPNITKQDDIFIQNTMKFVEENYANPDMNIDDIATNSGLSRSSFFKKLKMITGLAPVDFIKEFRVQRAMQLLEAGETNISQIAYQVGMDDPRYFSKCFKQKYGMNPREYKLKMNSGE